MSEKNALTEVILSARSGRFRIPTKSIFFSFLSVLFLLLLLLVVVFFINYIIFSWLVSLYSHCWPFTPREIFIRIDYLEIPSWNFGFFSSATWCQPCRAVSFSSFRIVRIYLGTREKKVKATDRGRTSTSQIEDATATTDLTDILSRYFFLIL